MKKENLIELANVFRKNIEKEFGKKCKDFDFGCVVCNAHKVVNGLEEIAKLLEVIDDNKKHEHKKKD